MPDETDPTLRGRLPTLFPVYDDSTEFEPWLDAHQGELDELDADLAQVKDEIHIGTATGQELDLIGEEYGVLGRRRGRADAAYRAYLMSLIASFQGVGTISGIKKAVSSGLLVDEDDVVIIEDFQQNKYDVRLLEWSAHSGSTVERLADLADPLAIELVKVQYDVGVDETRTADDVSVDSGLKVTDSATAADAVADVQTGDVPAGDSWDDESWDFMLWSEPEDLTRDAGIDTAVATDGVAVDPNETTVADAATTADGVSYSTDRTGWDVGDWDEIDWGATP